MLKYANERVDSMVHNMEVLDIAIKNSTEGEIAILNNSHL